MESASSPDMTIAVRTPGRAGTAEKRLGQGVGGSRSVSALRNWSGFPSRRRRGTRPNIRRRRCRSRSHRRRRRQCAVRTRRRAWPIERSDFFPIGDATGQTPPPSGDDRRGGLSPLGGREGAARAVRCRECGRAGLAIRLTPCGGDSAEGGSVRQVVLRRPRHATARTKTEDMQGPLPTAQVVIPNESSPAPSDWRQRARGGARAQAV